MLYVLEIILILIPLMVAGGLLLVGRRKGRSYRPLYLFALALLAAQALFWWYYAGLPEGGPEITWLVGLVASLLTVTTVLSTRWGLRLLMASALVVPLAFVAYTAGLYLFGEGVSDGAGGREPFTGMAFVSLMASIGMYSVPALMTWALLREGAKPLPTGAGQPPSGWYPDPGDPGAVRFWDGATWTEQTAARPPTAESVPPRDTSHRA